MTGRKHALLLALARMRNMSFLFELASGGVYHAIFVTKYAVRSYRALSALLFKSPHARKREEAFVHISPCKKKSSLCCTFRWLAPPGRYPAPCFHEARTFLIDKSRQTAQAGGHILYQHGYPTF